MHFQLIELLCYVSIRLVIQLHGKLLHPEHEWQEFQSLFNLTFIGVFFF